MQPADSDADGVHLKSFADVHEALLLREGLVMASYDAAKDLVFNNVLITLDGEPHLERRRLEMPLISPREITSLEGEVVPDIADEEIAIAKSDGEADLVTLSSRIATRATARLIGLDLDTDRDRADELARLMGRLHEGATIEYSKRPRDEVIEEVTVAKRSYEQNFVIPALHARQERIESDVSEDDSSVDLLSILATNREEHPQEWDQDRITCETIHYLVAGGGTTSSSVVSTMHELFGLFEDEGRRSQTLVTPEWLQAAAYEAMRLHPPSAYAIRKATADLTLSSGRTIDRGTTVILDLRSANRDTAVFGQDAAEFVPSRKTEGFPQYGLAFGAGAHVCMGKRLAAGTAHADNRVLGSVTRIVEALVRHRCVPHDSDLPELNELTTREQFVRYPVSFAHATSSSPQVSR